MPKHDITAYAGSDPYVFVSYSHADSDGVMDELARLVEHDIPFWYDEGIRPGENWPEELARAIDSCAVVLFFVTPRAAVSEHCVRETTFAINRRKPLVAVHLETTDLPPGLELSITDRQAIMKPELDEVAYVDKLVGALRGHLGKRERALAAQSADASGERKSVAVLPFKLRSRNEKDDYLTVALSEALITFLAGSDELAVRPWGEVERFGSQSVNARSAAIELGVQFVLDGSMQKIGENIRLQLQLWHRDAAAPMLSYIQDGDMASLFALQDEMAARVGDALGLGKTNPRERPPTHDAAAYELYMQGVERLNRANRWDMRTAVEMLKQATRLDGEFVDAWARLAQGCIEMALMYEQADPSWIRDAEHAVHRTLELDPTSSYGHYAHSRLLWTPAKQFQNRPALRAMGRALKLQPGLAVARSWQTLMLLHVGLFDAARSSLELATHAAPDDPLTHFVAGHVNLYAGSAERAVEFLQRALSLEPGQIYSNYFLACTWLYAGDIERAERALESSRHMIGDDPMLAATESLMFAVQGDADRAVSASAESLHKLETQGSSLHTHHIFHLNAAALAEAGETSRALPLVQNAIDNGLPAYPMFMADPFLAGLRDDADFSAMMSRLERQWAIYQDEFGG